MQRYTATRILVTRIEIRLDDRDMPNFVANFFVLKSTIPYYLLCLLPHWDLIILLLTFKQYK